MSLINDLFNTLDKRELSGMADTLGESDRSVSRGMQSAIATVLGGLATKSDSPSFLRKMLDLVPSGMGDAIWSNLPSGIPDTSSHLMSTGKTMLSTLFGGSEDLVARALSTGTGMKPGITSSLLTMAAPMVMAFLGRRVRDEGMSMGGLGTLLQRETPAIRAALPAGVTDLLWPGQRERVATAPVVAPATVRQRSTARWLVPLVLAGVIACLFWVYHRGSRRVIPMSAPSVGEANRVIPEAEVPKLPSNVDLYFQTGSSKLLPESSARLDKLAGDLAANRDARVTVNGYTDSVGSAESNMRLSQERADAVKADLEHKGIAANRLTAQGFGEENPVADNSTSDGRASNRRVSVETGTR